MLVLLSLCVLPFVANAGGVANSMDENMLSQFGSQTCRPGNYLNVHGGGCSHCPRGKFSPQTTGREIKCERCPEGKHTNHKEMKSCRQDDSIISYKCGKPNLPVLGGIDLVEIMDTYSTSGKRIVPPKGSSQFKATTAQTGQFVFWFKNQINMEKFKSSPLSYAPQAGGYCTFGISGYDPHGQGLFYSCIGDKDCYTIVNKQIFFFLSPDVMKGDFLGKGGNSERDNRAHGRVERRDHMITGAIKNFKRQVLGQQQQAQCYNTNLVGRPLWLKFFDDVEMLTDNQYVDLGDSGSFTVMVGLMYGVGVCAAASALMIIRKMHERGMFIAAHRRISTSARRVSKMQTWGGDGPAKQPVDVEEKRPLTAGVPVSTLTTKQEKDGSRAPSAWANSV